MWFFRDRTLPKPAPGDSPKDAIVRRDARSAWVWIGGRHYRLDRRSTHGSGPQEGAVTAPMTGTIARVSAKNGDAVEAGQALLVMTAMKMEYVLKAPRSGKVEKLTCKLGDVVELGTLLAKVSDG